jgi:hypothetical protein
METTLRFWNGYALHIVQPTDLKGNAAADRNLYRIYAAAESLDNLLALITEYRGEPLPAELAEHILKRWIRGGLPQVMEGKARQRSLWLDYGPIYGKEVTQIWPRPVEH